MHIKTISRRLALGLGVASLGACDSIFGSGKSSLPGDRQSVLRGETRLVADTDVSPVSLPAPQPVTSWPQVGGSASHAPGHVAAGGQLERVWRSSVGAGAGYRRKLPSTPVSDGRRIYTMDAETRVSAFEALTGNRVWHTDVEPDEADSTPIGGGIALEGNTLYVATGLAEILALDSDTGNIRWRKELPAPARGAPTVADGRVFIPLVEGRLIACSAQDGSAVWNYRSQAAVASILGVPAPAVSGPLVVAGFGSGELVGLRADNGRVAWSDSLASSRGSSSLSDLSAIRGMPVIDNGTVFAISVGGVFTAIDLRSGRRLWEREISGQETPCVAGSFVFVLSGEQELVAVGRNDGRIRWVRSLPAFGNPEKRRDPIIWTGPLLASGHLLIGNSESEMLLINPLNGETVREASLPAAASLPPIATGNYVYWLTDNGSVQALG